MKKIVSVQDISCYGQCSLTTALPILSAYGIETAILPSAILSTHTCGFQDFTCLDLTEEMPAIIRHWQKEAIRFDAIYTGYIGDSRQFSMIRTMKETLLKKDGVLIVDPAMADNGKLYPALTPDIVDGMREIVREADMILPNLTEAAFLLGEEYHEEMTEQETQEVLKRLSALGPEVSILTGVSYEADKLGAVAYEKSTGRFTTHFAERQKQSYHGTGDIFSSVAIAGYLNGKPLEEVLKDACGFVVSGIQKTVGDPSHAYGVKFEQVLAENR